MAHKSIPFRPLGHSGITVFSARTGLVWECPHAYGPTDEAESLRVLHRLYFELGGKLPRYGRSLRALQKRRNCLDVFSADVPA